MTHDLSMDYADYTINDPNPLKRWIQRRRYSDAVDVVRNLFGSRRIRILDFGAGNGELVRQISKVRTVEAWVFEPTAALMAQARKNLSGLESVSFVTETRSLQSGYFDCIFCLEVFEHLPKAESQAAFSEMHRLLASQGFILIGVPHEIFLPALVNCIQRVLN